MYITKIYLKNIKCIEEATINLASDDDFSKICMIFGDNGVGKTTILRCVVMCLAGEASASGLADDLEGEWLRNKDIPGTIRIELKSLEDPQKLYSIETTIDLESGGAQVVSEQRTVPEDFPWNKLFVCGYGAMRGIRGDTQYNNYSVFDSVRTLFVSDTGYLQTPELVIRRIKDKYSDDILPKIFKWFETILMLPAKSMNLNTEGLFVNWYNKSYPIGTLSDGYHATISWVADLLGWALLYDNSVFAKELSGIVLIDEIEQHLHPKWQKEIVSLLRNAFPKIQFFISTHSPIIAANTCNFCGGLKGSKLIYLNRKGTEGVIASEVQENLGELNLDQILSSEAFGYIFNVNPKIEGFLREASQLAAKDNLSSTERDQLNVIKERLKGIMFPKGKTLIERTVERDYYIELEKNIETFKKDLNLKNNDKN